MSTYDFITTDQSTSGKLAMYGLIIRARHEGTLWLSHFFARYFQHKGKRGEELVAPKRSTYPWREISKRPCYLTMRCHKKVVHFQSGMWSEQWHLCAVQEKLKEYVISGRELRFQKFTWKFTDLNKRVRWMDGSSGSDGPACRLGLTTVACVRWNISVDSRLL